MPSVRKINSKSGLWNYLQNSGALDRGNEAEIQNLKRAYRKEYLREHKRKQRAKGREVQFILSPADHGLLARQAKEHGTPLSRFISQSSLAYVGQRFLVPHAKQVALIEQHLGIALIEIEKLQENRNPVFFRLQQDIQHLTITIENMQKEIMSTLKYPYPMLQAVKEAAASDETFKKAVLNIIT